MNDDQRRIELSRFLRTRRQKLTPQNAGLQHVEYTRRRTKGLRREEVAALAGISLPWYTSLEQGRDINVSAQVLDSLARALNLSSDEREHLFFLASPPRQTPKPSVNCPVVSSSLQFLLDQMPQVPAYISDEKMHVLAWNRLASAVFGSFESTDWRDRNMIWRMFMLPSYRTLFIEWESLAGSLLGHFRSLYTRHIEDPWYTSFIAALMEGSPEFKAWWDSYEVQCTSQHPRVLSHPLAGLLNLETQLLRIEDSHDQFLNVFIPDSKDGSVHRLAKLAEEIRILPNIT
ncbi:helix-turn-helix transcriptional regulator [Paenibacillus soyae]|uniref:Helix-turn-helix transcriptional regulator n=1 Tax=Paenibacillus soyae TaxID=2969249 RepID=A0A9X2MU40_9BACL|nr:helix-turn-helix transcriptional regulator [Paenibacillus soyae]MCR2805878.1 helix-turn-helix transcriptional regulator [Paenibacillus soyae]